MNDIISLKENRDIVIGCLLLGAFLGIVTAVLAVKAKERFLATVNFLVWAWLGFWTWVGHCWLGFWKFVGKVLTGVWNNDYAVWMIICSQVGFEIFLLQQWIFVYNAVTSPGCCWDRYAYWPLTAVIPLFVANLFVAAATIGREADLCNGKK
jgi:hypothetical protein